MGKGFNMKKILHWNLMFNVLMEEYWDSKHRSIPIFLRQLKGVAGYYQCTPEGINDILLDVDCGASPVGMIGILLHEMCHHAVFEKYGIEVEEHGKEWVSEMERVGFSKPIVVSSGEFRFKAGQKDLEGISSKFMLSLKKYYEENPVIIEDKETLHPRLGCFGPPSWRIDNGT